MRLEQGAAIQSQVCQVLEHPLPTSACVPLAWMQLGAVMPQRQAALI